MSVVVQSDSRRFTQLFGISFVAAFSGAIMPGPVLAASIEQTARQGFIAIIGIMTGHAVLELALVILLMLGLHSLITRPKVRGTVAIIGGIAMILMGIDMARGAFHIEVDLTRSGKDAYSFPALMLTGVLLSLANPYFTGWWVTIGSGQLARLAPKTPAEYGSFYLGHEAGDYAWYTFVGMLVVTGRKWLSGPVYQVTILLCALAIAALGVYFLYTTRKLLRTNSATA